MPYSYASKKSYSRSYGKKKGYNKGPSSKVTRSDVVKIARQVSRKSLPTREARFPLDNVAATFHTGALANSFKYAVLTALEQGDQQNQRTGDKCYYAGAKFRFSCSNPLTVARAVRVIFARNINRNGDLLDVSTWTDLYTKNDETDRTADMKSGDLTSPLNTGVLEIFFDKTYHVRPDSTGLPLDISGYVKLNRKVEWDNLGTNYATVSNGSIYAIFHLIEPTDATSTSVSAFNAMIRVFYKDA